MNNLFWFYKFLNVWTMNVSKVKPINVNNMHFIFCYDKPKMTQKNDYLNIMPVTTLLLKYNASFNKILLLKTYLICDIFHIFHSKNITPHVKKQNKRLQCQFWNLSGEFQSRKHPPRRPLYTIVRTTCGLEPVLCIRFLGLAQKLWSGTRSKESPVRNSLFTWYCCLCFKPTKSLCL